MDNFYGRTNEHSYPATIRALVKLAQDARAQPALVRDYPARGMELHLLADHDEDPDVKLLQHFPMRLKSVLNKFDGAVAYFAEDLRPAARHNGLAMQLGFFLGRVERDEPISAAGGQRVTRDGRHGRSILLLADDQGHIQIPSNLKGLDCPRVGNASEALERIAGMVRGWDVLGHSPMHPREEIEHIRLRLKGTELWSPGDFRTSGYSGAPICSDAIMLGLAHLGEKDRFCELISGYDQVRSLIGAMRNALTQFFACPDKGRNFLASYRRSVKDLSSVLREWSRRRWDDDAQNRLEHLKTLSEMPPEDDLRIGVFFLRFLCNVGVRVSPKVANVALRIALDANVDDRFFDRRPRMSDELDHLWDVNEKLLYPAEVHDLTRLIDCADKISAALSKQFGKDFTPLQLHARMRRSRQEVKEILDRFDPFRPS